MNIIHSCTIYFVRHGQSVANTKKLVGIPSSPLSSLGIRQVNLLDKKIPMIKFSAIYSSEYIRALKTAEILAHGNKIKVDKRLNEWNIGRLDGKKQSEFNDKTSAYFSNKDETELKEVINLRLYPEMETPAETIDRIVSFIEEISKNYLGSNVLAVTHGATLGFLLIYLGKLKLQQMPLFGKIIPNTRFIQISSDGNDIKWTK